MNENLDYLRRLFGRRGESLGASRETLLAEFATEEDTLTAYNNVIWWEDKIMRDWHHKTMKSDLINAPVTLANGMVGRDYRAEIRLGSMDRSLGDHRCILENLPGLSYDPATRELSGMPSEAGEFDIVLEFRLAGITEGPWARKVVKFIVNHDPKSLWKNEPSDREDPYWQTDEAAAAAGFGSHTLLVASKRGRSHAHEGKFRDDAFSLEYSPDTGWGIVAVSDGAGASKYSRKGSVLACDAVRDFFRNLPTEKWTALDTSVSAYLEGNDGGAKHLSGVLTETIGNAALDAQHAIRKEATLKGAEMRDYSCTLIFALCKQYPTHFVTTSFWVGDGGIGVYQEPAGIVDVLGEPDSGEYAGQTRFLTMPEIFADRAHFQRIKFKAVEKFTALVLMTDGITDPKFQTDANLKNPAIWKSLWDEIAAFGAPAGEGESAPDPEARKTALLDWLDFWSPGNHDDRTIAILYGAP
jgi:hypothetical protein